MQRAVLLLAMMAALSCCASYGDIRSKMATSEKEIAKPVEALSDCALDKLQLGSATGQVGGLTFTQSRDGTARHIAAQLNGFFGPQSFQWDLTFVPMSTTRTRVELRTARDKTLFGAEANPEVWTALDSCS